MLKDPKNQLDRFYAININYTIQQPNPQINELGHLVFSLEFAAIISFLIFAIILISIIVIATRYDIFAKFFAFLLALLLFFSFSYLITSFKDSIIGLLVLSIPLLIFLGYLEIMEILNKKYRRNSTFDFGYYWYLILDLLAILGFGIWNLIQILFNFQKSIEVAYFVLFLIFCMVIVMSCIPFHLMILQLTLFDRHIRINETLSDYCED